MSYNRVKNSKRITQVLLCCLGLWNLALAISTSCLSRVLLCPGSCTFVIPIYKCLYFCHSFIQAPVLLSVFLSTAKTFCSACMTLSGVKKQGRSSSSFHKHLSILTNKATCNSYKQVPVLLSLLYSSACTFVSLLIINGENILCSAFWRYQASKGNPTPHSSIIKFQHQHQQPPAEYFYSPAAVLFLSMAKTFCAMPAWRYQASKSEAIPQALIFTHHHWHKILLFIGFRGVFSWMWLDSSFLVLCLKKTFGGLSKTFWYWNFGYKFFSIWTGLSAPINKLASSKLR